MALTEAAIKDIELSEKRQKLFDGGGLHLLVTPQGAKLWRLAYRFAGKQKQLALGSHPAIKLVAARRARDDAKRLLLEGTDPGAQRKAKKREAAERAVNTFRVIAEEWIAKEEREGRAPATMEKTRWLLDDLAYPDLGDRPASEITPPDLLAVLKKPESRGKYEAARNLKSVCGRVFRYAIATGRAERDASQDLRGALTTPK